MDDDVMSREQATREAVARGWCDPANSHKEMDVILAESIVREVCALESRSEVLTNKRFAEEQAERIVNSADAQCFRWLVKHHSGSDGERCFIGGVDFTGDDIHIAILDAIDREESPRAEPGAPTLEQDSQETYHFAEHEPDHAADDIPPGRLAATEHLLRTTPQLPPDEPASAAPEHAAAPLPDSIASEPTLNLAEVEGTAAAPDVKEAYSRDYAQGRARGFEEGLEEAAKVCERFDELTLVIGKPISTEAEFHTIARELFLLKARAIRAKIKPTRGS